MRGWLVAVLVVSVLSAGVAVAQPVEEAGDPAVQVVDLGEPIGRSTQIAALAFPEGAPTVYLARADVVADALAAGPVDGPVLLVPTCGPVPDVTAGAITALSPDSVVALGGTAAVCDELLADAADGRATSRLAGDTRIETAIAIATAFSPAGAATAYIASAADSPDAVTAGTADDGPVLLVPPTGTLPPAVVRALVDLQVAQVVVFGGTAAVADEVLEQLDGLVRTVRLAGANRFETAGITAGATFGPGSRTGRAATTAHLVDGAALADAVAAASTPDGPVLLTGGCDQPLPPAVTAQLQRLQPDTIVVVDPQAVCEPLVQAAVTASRTAPPTPADDHEAAVGLPQVLLPGAGSACADAPASPLLPPQAACVQTVALDLDGQGGDPATLDRLVTWHDPVTGSQTVLTVTSTDRRASTVVLPAAGDAGLPPAGDSRSRTAIGCTADITGGGADIVVLAGRSVEGETTDVVVTAVGGDTRLVTSTATREPVLLRATPGGPEGRGWRLVPTGRGVVTTSYDAEGQAGWTRLTAVGTEVVPATPVTVSQATSAAAPDLHRHFGGTGCRPPATDDRLVLGLQTVGPAPMGSAYTPARSALDEVLGPPVAAGDWRPGVCAPQERVVGYDSGLRLVFDRSGPPSDGALNYLVADFPLVVATDRGAVTGMTVGELQAAHPDLRLTIQAGSPRALLDDGAAFPRLAQLTGIGTRDVVTLLYQTRAAGC